MRKSRHNPLAVPGYYVSGRGAEVDEILNQHGFRRGVLVALRLAATLDGAPSRCPRRDCRRLGRCRAERGDDGEPRCHAPISENVAERAADMLLFLSYIQKDEWAD